MTPLFRLVTIHIKLGIKELEIIRLSNVPWIENRGCRSFVAVRDGRWWNKRGPWEFMPKEDQTAFKGFHTSSTLHPLKWTSILVSCSCSSRVRYISFTYNPRSTGLISPSLVASRMRALSKVQTPDPFSTPQGCSRGFNVIHGVNENRLANQED